MSGGHAILAPSAAKRWMLCPGSVKASAGYEDTSSPSADRGTAAHHVLAECLLDMTRDPRSYVGQTFKLDGMGAEAAFEAEDAAAVLVARNHVVQTIQSLQKAGHEHRLLIEQKVFPGAAFSPPRREECHGTGDIFLIGGGVLRSMDYKHGSGVFVPADDPQLLLYGIGGMRECLPPEAQRVETTVIQPRYPGALPVRSATHTPEKMADYRDQFSKAAILALDNPDPPLVPGEEQCRFCPAKADCPARREWTLAKVSTVFSEVPAPAAEEPVATAEPSPPPAPSTDAPASNWGRAPLAPASDAKVVDDFLALFTRDVEGMSPESYARVLESETLIRGWLESVHQSAHAAMKNGLKVPGFKLVRGRGSRSWEDEDAVRTVLSNMSKTKDAGGGKLKKSDYLVESLLSPKQAEDRLKPLLSRAGWEKVSASISKSPGKPVIAPETDTREEVITNAAEVFSPVEPAAEGEAPASPDLSFLG